MEKELEEFKLQVLTQLAVINSKLDGYGEIKKTVYETENRSKKNESDIKEIQDNNKWLKRTSLGAIITSSIGLLFLIAQTLIKIIMGGI